MPPFSIWCALKCLFISTVLILWGERRGLGGGGADCNSLTCMLYLYICWYRYMTLFLWQNNEKNMSVIIFAVLLPVFKKIIFVWYFHTCYLKVKLINEEYWYCISTCIHSVENCTSPPDAILCILVIWHEIEEMVSQLTFLLTIYNFKINLLVIFFSIHTCITKMRTFPVLIFHIVHIAYNLDQYLRWDLVMFSNTRTSWR